MNDSASPLLDTSDNPAPVGAELLTLTTRDGVDIRAVLWRGEGELRLGTVLIMQGRAEFVEKYFEVVGELLARGFAVACFDWRGQGGSGRALADGRKGHVRHFDDFRHDLDAALDAVRTAGLPAPLYGLAHSMGGCVALTGLAEGWLVLDRLVASTPMIELAVVRRPVAAGRVARTLRAFGLGGCLVPGGRLNSISTEPFAGNRLSGDPRRYGRNSAVAAALGPGAIGSPTIGWLAAASDAMARLRRAGYGETIRVPTLIIGAGDDPVCSTAAAALFAKALGPAGYVEIPGSRHEVMMETDAVREAFWRAFDAFIPGTAEEARDAALAGQEAEQAVVQAGIA